MKNTKKIWIWLNGKKTIIGLLGLQIISYPFTERWDPQIVDILTWTFNILAGGGLLHKGTKYLLPKKAK